MSIIDRVTAHYDSLAGGRVDVPEWGDESAPLVVHWRELTLEEHSRLQGLSKGDNFKLACFAVARNARDDGGNRLFDEGDAYKLMRGADRGVILRIAGSMLDVPEVSDAEKN